MTPTTRSNREHSFDWELAVIVGHEKAILLKNIAYWCEENERRGLADYFQHGQWWTRESLKSLSHKYPYFTMPSISRWMNQLCADRWVRMFGQSGGTNFYAPGEIFNAWNSGADWKALIDNQLRGGSQNENPTDLLKMRTPVSQNEKVGVLKMRNRGSQNEKHEYRDIERQIDVDVECGARAQKPSFRRSQKSDTKSPPVAPAPPRAVVLYADSNWPIATFQDWCDDFLPRCEDLPNVDAAYYRNRVRDWSEQSQKGSANWPSKAATFAHDDQAKQRLHTIQQLSHDQHSDSLNPPRPSAAKPRFSLELSSPAELQAAAAELLARRGRRNQYRPDGN